jgi:hypothetical protein
MSYSSAFGQRIAMVLVLVAPLGLVNCGDDDGGGGSPTVTGGSGGKGGSATTGGSGGKATGGAPSGGIDGKGGSTGGGGAVTGGSPSKGGEGGAEAGAPGEGGSAGSETGGGGGAFGGEAGDSGDAGETGEGGGAGGGGETEAVNSILIGSFAPLPAYDDLEISGQALLVRTGEDETKVSVQVVGLLEETEYPVHVHNLPCEFLAGTHYKFDPAETDTVEANEVWPMFETDAAGVGMAEVTVDHWLRGDAMAVVVHDPEVDGNPKMACADLTLDSDAPLSAKGTFNGFAQSEDQDETIDGSVELAASEDGTELSYEISGFAEDDTEYMAHVHALPCVVTDAGGHYKLDPTVADTVEANELWLDLGSTEDGEAADSIASEHRVRLDAQSVVIHRAVDDDTVLKVACAPLEVEAYPDILVEGTGVSLEAAEEKNLDDLQALASLRRTIAGATRVRVTAVGLGAGLSYPAHVHALPCSIESGGPHYKIDTSEADTVEENELWLTLATDADGVATSEQSFDHIARADARSIVIHDPEDNARLACIDLAP